jgi:uncharacterized protein YdeI (YjbR/CyaY-like superfamily)
MAEIISTEVIAFASAREMEKWLAKNHATSTGIWLRFYKNLSGVPSVTYAEALDAALCYGWIDGQLKKADAQSYLQRFTPRRPKSIWSKRNQGLIEKLIEAGKMRPAGREQIEAAKADGRWDRAYDSPGKMKVPEDFLAELAKNKKASAFFQTLNRTNLYSIGWRLQTATTPAARLKRQAEIIAKLARGEKFH